MPQDVEYGGTQGVDVLDLGVKGGTLAGSGFGRSTIALTIGDLIVPTHESAVPDNDLIAVQKLGAHGRTITASGVLIIKTHETMDGVIDNLDSHKANPVQMRPTRLRRNLPIPVKSWSKVYLDTYDLIVPRRTSSGDWIIQPYRIRFRVLEV